MPSDNRILTIKINSENKIIHTHPENHYFLTNNTNSTFHNVPVHQAIKSELYEYYLTQSYKIHSGKPFDSYPAQIIFIDEIKHLVQLHYENHIVNHKDVQSILYFNFINIESYSKGRNLEGCYLEDKAIEMQLEAAFEQIKMLATEDNNWITEDFKLFNTL